VFERALALDPRARQKDAGVFWNELVAALAQPEPVAKARSLESAEELEFDPTSVRKPAPAAVRVSAPYAVATSAPARGHSTVSANALTAAVSMPHFVPDLELTPPSVFRRASGERPAVKPEPAPTSVLDLDSATMPAALSLDLDLPAHEPRPQRSMSSQSLAAAKPIAERPSNAPPARATGLSGSMAAVLEPQPGQTTSGVSSTRTPKPELHLPVASAFDPARSARNSRPPSAEASAPFETGFVAKIDPKLFEERSLAQRLRPASALFAAAILVALLDPIYAAATGEVLEILGQRLSLLAGALLVLAIGLAVRELIRET
jgi:hypothetical protein